MEEEKSYKPLYDRVVMTEQFEEETESGILLPYQKEDKQNKAKVISVGPECKHVSPGDIVYYQNLAAEEFVIDKETVLIIRETNIIVVL